MTTLQATRSFLAQQLAIAEGAITPESNHEIDALSMIELLHDIEEEFGISLSNDDGRVRTVGDLLVAVAWELAQRCASSR